MFDSIIKKMSWIDFKISGIIGIGVGILLTQNIDWFINLYWGWTFGVIILCYIKILYSLLIK